MSQEIEDSKQRLTKALKQVIKAIRYQKPEIIIAKRGEAAWNPNYHIEITLTYAECREIIQAYRQSKELEYHARCLTREKGPSDSNSGDAPGVHQDK